MPSISPTIVSETTTELYDYSQHKGKGKNSNKDKVTSGYSSLSNELLMNKWKGMNGNINKDKDSFKRSLVMNLILLISSIFLLILVIIITRYRSREESNRVIEKDVV